MKTFLSIVYLCLFILPLTTVCGQSSQADLLADWERAKAFTLEYLEAMPAESYDLKPSPEMRSFAQQMLHLTDGNYGFAAAATGTESPVERGGSEKATDQSKENVTRLVTEGYDFVIQGLNDMEEEAMTGTVQLFGRFEMSRAMALAKAFEHQTHHRGQATVYLRMAGVEPPAEKLF